MDLEAGDREATLAPTVRGHFLDERDAAPALGDDDRAVDDRAGAGAPVLLHLERELDRDARGHVDERAAVGEGGAIERAERAVALQGASRRERAPDEVRMRLQRVSEAVEDDALVRR